MSRKPKKAIKVLKVTRRKSSRNLKTLEAFFLSLSNLTTLREKNFMP